MRSEAKGVEGYKGKTRYTSSSVIVLLTRPGGWCYQRDYVMDGPAIEPRSDEYGSTKVQTRAQVQFVTRYQRVKRMGGDTPSYSVSGCLSRTVRLNSH